MADTLCQFLTWAVKDVIFFSGDVQTTTIAVAITSSLCCSLVFAMVHVMALIRPVKRTDKREHKSFRSNSLMPSTTKRISSEWLSNGQIHVPCVKCGTYFADIGCRFVTCKSCCFSKMSCQIHEKPSVFSTPCNNKQTEMDLSSVGMIECPERLGFIGSQLTFLNLADNQLTELPPEIGCLRGLLKLSVKNNKLQSLPTTIGALSQLLVLDVSYNEMTEIPKCVTSLFNLQELFMSNNDIESISPDIAQLTQLQIVDFSHNQLEDICDALFNFLQLEYLYLEANPIGNIPTAVGNLVQLNCLDLRSCDLTSLPITIGNCSKLDSLKLNNNKLKSIPWQVGRLCKLQHLSLDHNCLTHLPAMLSFLPESVRITVDGNPLLSPDDYNSFAVSPGDTGETFPSLQELTARELVKHNIQNVKSLPQVLQDMVSHPKTCSKCGGPLFQFYKSQMQSWHFPGSNTDQIPLFYQYCSPHKPQGCG